MAASAAAPIVYRVDPELLERFDCGTAPRLAMYWRPARNAEARSCLVFVHGFGEHAGRYQRIFEHLPDQHICALDLRGHGHSEGQRGHVDRFEDYHQDLDLALQAARERSAGLPCTLIAHSVGGLIASHYCLHRRPGDLLGLVLSSPALKFRYRPPAWERAAAWLANALCPRFSRPARLDVDRLSHDPQVASGVRADPLAFNQASARWYHEALRAQVEVRAAPQNQHQPTLCLYSGDDALVVPEATAEFCQGLPDGRSLCFPDCYHELFQEVRATEILAEVARQCRSWEQA